MKSPQVLYKEKVKFLYEQTGQPEDTLKAALCKLFESDGYVTKAYLTRVVYDDRNHYDVALCLFISDANQKDQIQERVGLVFSKIFSTHEALDIIFPTEQQSKELVEVCEAFYISSKKDSVNRISDTY